MASGAFTHFNFLKIGVLGLVYIGFQLLQEQCLHLQFATKFLCLLFSVSEPFDGNGFAAAPDLFDLEPQDRGGDDQCEGEDDGANHGCIRVESAAADLSIW